MNSKVKWGILSTASIGTEQVIPAMIKGEKCDLFSLAILNDTPVPTPLQDAVDNMIVIERLLKGA